MRSKILVIEDDRVMRENTAELLELSGYEVTVAQNGKVGLEKVSSFQPDLILCDIMMPELDGYGVLYVLSKKVETAAIPFIFLTAKAEKSDLRKGMNLGADDYLTKPFEDSELMQAVESRLSKNAIVKRDYSNNINGLERFMEEARDLKAIESLVGDRKSYAYGMKEFIFREGDVANFLYFIEKGRVKTFLLNDEGKEYILDTYEAGDFLGHTALLENRSYTEFASPLEDTEIYKIPKEDFLGLLFNNRDVAVKFIRLLSKNLSDKEEELLHLAYDSVNKRLALQLKELFNGNSKKTITMSRTDLANMIGTSKETVVRCLAHLKEDKVIETDGQTITLVKDDGLDRVLQWS